MLRVLLTSACQIATETYRIAAIFCSQILRVSETASRRISCIAPRPHVAAGAALLWQFICTATFFTAIFLQRAQLSFISEYVESVEPDDISTAAADREDSRFDKLLDKRGESARIARVNHFASIREA